MSQLKLVCQLLLTRRGEREQSLGKIGLRRTWRPVPLIVRLSCQDNEAGTASRWTRGCWEGWAGSSRGRAAWATSPLHLPLPLLRPLRHCSWCLKRRGGGREKEGWTGTRCIISDEGIFNNCLQDLGARLRFAIVGPDDLDTVNKLLYATYHPYEPLTKHLDLCKGLNSLKDVDRMVEEKLAKYLTL